MDIKKYKTNSIKSDTPIVVYKYYENRTYVLKFNNKAADLMQLNNQSSIMLSFNYKGKRAYIWKEDNEDDNFRVMGKPRKGMFIYCTSFADQLKKTFDITENIQVFALSKSKQNKFKIICLN